MITSHFPQTINFREEREKENVWGALMNLENMYGTREGLMTVFKQASQFCDDKRMHIKVAHSCQRKSIFFTCFDFLFQLLDIFEKNGNEAEISELYKVCGFRTCCSRW